MGATTPTPIHAPATITTRRPPRYCCCGNLVRATIYFGCTYTALLPAACAAEEYDTHSVTTHHGGNDAHISPAANDGWLRSPPSPRRPPLRVPVRVPHATRVPGSAVTGSRRAGAVHEFIPGARGTHHRTAAAAGQRAGIVALRYTAFDLSSYPCFLPPVLQPC